ncbi:MAG: multidrug efflux pump protein [Bacteroidia bacterium]|nr:MAG: multidrug efflux pump protein [Bacteroidia bacterium]
MNFYSRLLRRRVTVSTAACAVFLLGVFALTRLPLELAPTLEFQRLSVVTFWGYTSPETVEQFLTSPIEEVANTVKGVRKVSSVSEEGRSTVDIEFDRKTDMNFARLELGEKLATLAEKLPPGTGYPEIQRYIPRDLRDLQGFMAFSLVGNEPAHVLREYASTHIAPTILAINGIADVQVLGGQAREVSVEIDPKRSAALGVTIDDVRSSLREAYFAFSAGAIRERGARTLVTVRKAPRAVSELEEILVKEADGMTVRLKDIGVVEDGLAEPTSYYRVNAKPTVTLVIDKSPGINTLRLADAVLERISELRRDFPAGTDLVIESDKSRSMRLELERLYNEIIVSLVCIVLVLVLFLRNFRVPLILLSSIVLSIAGTFLLFWILGVGLNLLSLAGLVLGFGRLVDDSIVVVENIRRNRESGQENSVTTVERSVSEISLPIIASTFATVGALFPLYFLSEDLKPYLVDFSIAVAVSLLISLLVSLTVIPTVALKYDLRKRHIEISKSSLPGSRFYRKALAWALGRRKLVLLLAIWVIGLPTWLLPERIESETFPARFYNMTIGSEFYSTIRPLVNYALGGTSHLFFAKVAKGEVWGFGEQTYLLVTISFSQGTQLHRYDDVARDVEELLLLEKEGIQKVTTRVSPDYAVIRADIKESAALSVFPYELKNKLVLFAAQTGGATVSVSGFGPGFFTGGETAPSFFVKVRGYNYNRVKALAEEFRTHLEKNPRITEVDIDRSFGRWNKAFELVTTIDRQAAEKHGVSVSEVVRAIRSSTQGTLDRHRIRLGNEQIPSTVRFAGYKDFSIDDLKQIVIVNSHGEAVRMGDVIRFAERRVPARILREGQQYERWVSFEYRGPYRFGTEFVDAAIQSIVLPNGYSIERPFLYFEFAEADVPSLFFAFLGAVLMIFMITASLYESFLKPAVILLSIPFSFVGVFAAFYIADVPFGRGGYAGLMLLIGIVTTNSIVLVDFMARKTAEANTIANLSEAAFVRVRPILMTTLTTIGGMIPVLIMSDQASIWYGLSLAAIAGLLSSTLLTLLVLPVFYAWALKTRP